jgi:very-short-patch-repair endonuclease
VIVEVDGERYHSTRWRRRQDAAKTAALRGQGWTAHRFSDTEIAGTPADVAEIVLTSMRGPRHFE